MLADGIHAIQVLATNITVLALVVLLLVAAGVAWWLRRTGRSDRPYALLFAAFASLALIIAVTLVRDRPAFTPEHLFSWSTSGWQRISYDPWNNVENLLNVVLFIPAGVAWTLLTGKPWRVLVALLGGAFLVECLQAVTAAGANDVADLVTNGLGGAVGVLAGTVVRWLVQGRRSRPSGRQAALAAGCAVAVAAAAVAGLLVGAEHRQAALEQEVNALFAGTSLELYRDWEAEDLVTHEVFGAASVFADGTRHLDDAVRVRYPASFFGLRRCVFVEWTPGDVEIYRGAGAECTEFIG